MRQEERRIILIKELLQEYPGGTYQEIPDDIVSQKKLLRSLMNVRPPRPVSQEFLEIQDAYLQEELAQNEVIQKQVESIAFLLYFHRGIYVE